jgi:hypothetical protein
MNHESNKRQSALVQGTEESRGGLIQRLTTPPDKDVHWRLPTKVVTSWTAVGGDHELRA